MVGNTNMTIKLTDESAEQYLEQYRKHGMDYAFHNSELNKFERKLDFQKASNLISNQEKISVTHAKANANANENLLDIMEIIAHHEHERDKAHTEMHYFRMKFGGWKAETFRKSNEEYFEQKVYTKT